MLAVFLVYFGFLTVLLSAGCQISRSRWLPAWGFGEVLALLTLGLVMFVVGMSLPAPEEHVVRIKTRLDEFIPSWQFREVHSARIRATPARVYQAIREVRATEILFFRALTWLRRFGRPGPEGILNAPARRPLLEVATSTSFLALADDPNRELVVGTFVIAPVGMRRRERTTPEEFAALRSPGFAKAALNFIIDDEGDVCRVTTETRVYATDAATRRRFAVYWRVIYPGSSLIRWMWLRAIKLRAEAPQSPLPLGEG
jgi:hypothetical protein